MKRARVPGLRRWMCAASLMAATLACPSARAGELMTWPAHDGATERGLLSLPAGAPQWIVLLFPGDDGALGLSAAGAVSLRGNFLVHTADFWPAGGDAALLVDAPSDHADGMDDAFRLSAAAGADAATVVASLRTRFPQARIALIGTSRGTITVGNILQREPGLADAYVMTSPVTVARVGQPGLSGMSWPGSRARVLVVSNRADACPVSPFANAEKLARQNGFDFMPVSSEASGTRAQQCSGRAPHGYAGVENSVLGQIRGWLRQTPPPGAPDSAQ
jgi:predicted esterase